MSCEQKIATISIVTLDQYETGTAKIVIVQFLFLNTDTLRF